jgi:pentatricopeptide repeat protein
MATFRERLELLVDANVAGFVAAMDKAGAAADKNLGKETTGKLDALAGKFTVMGAAAVGGASVAAIGLGKLATIAGEAQVAQAKLDNSVANSSQKFKDNGAAISDLATELQKKVAVDDEAIRSGQAVLIQFGLTEDQVKRLTPLVVDLSRKMGVDMDTAAKAVGRSATGSTTALRRMGIDVTSLGEGATDAEKTISALSKSVGGFAQAEGRTFNGQLTILKNQLSELGESVGMGAAGTLQSIVGGLNSVASAANDVSPGLSAAVGSFATLATIGVGGLGALSFAAGQFIAMRDNLGPLVDKLKNAEGQLTRFGQVAAGLGGVVVGAAVVAGVIEIGNQFNKASQDAKAFNDSLLVLQGAAQGDAFTAFATAVNANIGTLDEVSQGVDDFAKKLGPLGVGLVSAASGPVGVLTAGLASLNNLLGNNSDLWISVQNGAQRTSIDLNQLGETVDKIAESGSLAALQSTYDQLAKLSETKITGPNAEEATKALTEQRDRTKELLDAALNQSAAQRNVEASTKTAAAAARDQALAAGQTADGLQQVSATAADLKDKSDELTLSQKRITSAFDANQAASKGFAGALGFVTNNAAQVIDSAQSVGKAVNDVFKPTTGADGQQIAAVIGALPADFNALTAVVGGYNDAQNKAIDGLQQYGAAAQQQLSTLLSTGATTQQVQDAAKGYADFIRSQLIPVFQAQGSSTEDAKAKAEAYIKQLGLTPDQVNTQIVLGGVEAARQQLQFLQGDFDNIPDTVRKEIYAAVRRGEWDEALRIYNQFKDKGVVITVDTKVIGDFLSGNAPGVFGIKLPKRAAGGPVMKDKTYLVGEKGPELFTPGASGGITPNDTLRGIVNSSTSSSQVNQSTTFAPTFNISGANDPTTTARETVRKMRDMAFLGA